MFRSAGLTWPCLPLAAETNDYQLRSLNNTNLFWSSETLKSRSHQSCFPSGSSKGRYIFPLPFSFLEVTCTPGLVAASSIFKAAKEHPEFFSLIIQSPFYKDPYDSIGLTQITQNRSPIFFFFLIRLHTQGRTQIHNLSSSTAHMLCQPSQPGAPRSLF